jgi:hypothetical protein
LAQQAKPAPGAAPTAEEGGEQMKEKKLVSPTVGRYDENDVMQIVPSELLEEYSRTKRVGDTLCSFAGAPGTGRVIERITRMDATGIYGVVVENTMRELEPWEVE